MKNLKDSRIFSFIIIFVVYVIATVVGVLVYNALSFEFYINLLIADVVATAVVFIFSVVLNNASVYDPYWSVLPVIVMAFYVAKTGLTVVTILPLIAICLWGVRLTANWAYTFHGLKHQDWRYTMLKEKTGAFYPLVNFLGIHLFPTLVVYGCILPAVFIFKTENLAINVGSILFFVLSIFAVILQGVSDCQMHAYRKNRNGNFIRKGLWKYSRHPNYLGEILMWWGVALYLMTIQPNLWYLCAGALVNTLMFIFISIPMADKRQSKKQGFNEYKVETRMLLPIKK